MSPDIVRSVAAVLSVVLTAGCGASFEDLRPEEPIARAQASRESVVFIPREPRTRPAPEVSEAELRESVRWMMAEVRLDRLRAEWRRIVADAHFRPLRAEKQGRPYRLMLASWSPSAA